MQPNLDPAWNAIRDELVAAGGFADGSNVLFQLANRTVVVTPATNGTTLLVIAPIARASQCNATQALVLAKDLELGGMIVVRQMLALRHIVPIHGTSASSIHDNAKQLAHAASLIAPALIDRTRTRSIEASSAFAYCAE